MSIWASLVFLGICGLTVANQLRRIHPVAGSLGLISPSVIFFVGVAGRYGLGSLIMASTPREYVLSGELDQYIVSWKYSADTVGLWLVYVGGVIVTLSLLARLIGTKAERVKGDCGRHSVFDAWKAIKSGKETSPRVFITLLLVLLGIFFAGSIVAAWSGSLDRGSQYVFWASKEFRPESSFIAVTRLRQVAYFLVPATLVGRKKIIRYLVITLVTIPLIAESLAGGRGSVLYPVVMLMLGWITIEKRRGRLITGLSLALLISAITVPYMAAYRDSQAFRQSSHRNVIERAKAIFAGVDYSRIVYRFQALGREVYACSDAFLFVPENKRHLGAGFVDIDVDLITDTLKPRWLSSNKKLEKFDGAAIAQRLMGVRNKTWFPCISTPGDLWRRGGYLSLLVGGCLMGCILYGLDYGWARVGSTYGGAAAVLVTLLPVSYIQSGLFGTLREILWQLSWDLPKYLVICIMVSIVIRGLRWRIRGGGR